MSKRHLDFDTGDPESPSERVPIDFDAVGENFICVADWPAAAFIDVATAHHMGMTPSEELFALGSFFDMVLEPESQKRFEAAMRRSGPSGLRMSKVISIYHGLIGEYQRPNPTGGSSDSPDGPEGTGESSTDEPPEQLADGTP